MPARGDDPRRPSPPASPWVLEELEPTTLVALWPDDRAPTRTEVESALAGATGGGARVVDELAHDDPDVAWNAVVEVPGHEHAMILWCERAHPVPPEELDDPAARAARWVVGLQTPLAAGDPLTSFVDVIRTLCAAVPDAPALLDVNTSQWLPRRRLEELFLAERNEPPAEVLWVIHAVTAEPDRPGADTTWLHTHGLWRCGLAELEMLEVPARRAGAAAQLLNEIAQLMLELAPPPAGEPYEIGTGLHVVLQPWQAVVETMDPQAPGGRGDRDEAAFDEQTNPHAGRRAVVCESALRGRFRRAWVWPEGVVERLEDDAATLFRTRRATERAARLAQGTWDQLATAFSTVRRHRTDVEGDEVLFGVKAGFANPDAADGAPDREHLWFEALEFDGDRVSGRLLNTPLFVSRLSLGDVRWIDRDMLSDWMVHMPRGDFGPSDVQALWRAIDELGGAA